MIKTRHIRLKTDTIDSSSLAHLAHLDGVHVCVHQAGKLVIEYDSARCAYRTIHRYLTDQGLVAAASLLEKIKHALIMVAEQNERDHNATPCGWDYYVQRIYLSSRPLDNPPSDEQ